MQRQRSMLEERHYGAAAGNGHEAVVKLLIGKGADVKTAAAGKAGRTALQVAAEHGHEAAVKLLIDKGADVGQPFNGNARDLGPYEYAP